MNEKEYYRRRSLRVLSLGILTEMDARTEIDARAELELSGRVVMWFCPVMMSSLVC